MKKRVNAGNFYRECEMLFAKNLNLALATVPPMARWKVHTLFSVPSLFSVSSWALSMFDLRSKILGYAQTVVCFGRHYILPTKTTSIKRDWDWILNYLKVVTGDSRKMYGWYARTTEHPNSNSAMSSQQLSYRTRVRNLKFPPWSSCLFPGIKVKK